MNILKKHLIVYFEGVNFILCEFYLNKKQLLSNSLLGRREEGSKKNSINPTEGGMGNEYIAKKIHKINNNKNINLTRNL